MRKKALAKKWGASTNQPKLSATDPPLVRVKEDEQKDNDGSEGRMNSRSFSSRRGKTTYAK